MDTLLYRKIAQIAHRDGEMEIHAVAARYMPKYPGDRGPDQFRNSDKKRLKRWFLDWLNDEARNKARIAVD